VYFVTPSLQVSAITAPQTTVTKITQCHQAFHVNLNIIRAPEILQRITITTLYPWAD